MKRVRHLPHAIALILAAVILGLGTLSAFGQEPEPAPEPQAAIPTPGPFDESKANEPFFYPPTPPELLSPFDLPCDVAGITRRAVTSPYKDYEDGLFDACGNLVGFENSKTGEKIAFDAAH